MQLAALEHDVSNRHHAGDKKDTNANGKHDLWSNMPSCITRREYSVNTKLINKQTVIQLWIYKNVTLCSHKRHTNSFWHQHQIILSVDEFEKELPKMPKVKALQVKLCKQLWTILEEWDSSTKKFSNLYLVHILSDFLADNKHDLETLLTSPCDQITTEH